jgi:alpha-galactosidase
VYSILSAQAGLESYAGPGHWNDPDMLEVGNGRLNIRENRSHFSMWAMLAAPLLAGNDLPNMKPEIKEILTSKDVIAIDQDKLGKQARRVYSEGEVDVWERDLAGGAKAIAILSAGSDRYSTHPFHLSLEKLGLHGPQKGRDLWARTDVTLTDNMPVELGAHDVLLVRIENPK